MQRLKFILSMLFCLLIITNSYSSNAILKDIRGQSIPFDSLKGKWVLINYWASWCQPCLDEISELNRFYKKNKDRVALFAVNFDSLPIAQQIALIRRHHISYPSLRSSPARDLKLGDIRGVPATFVFNPQGQYKETLYGEQSQRSLNKATTG